MANNKRNNNNKGGGNSVNQEIQKQISKAGQNLNYREASAVAQQLGVSVDRVYNQTQKTGQAAVAGSFAANAGYTPAPKVNGLTTANNNRSNNKGGGNTVNQQIQKQISRLGDNLNYREASAVAERLGVSVDRVYNQTQRTGQSAVAGTFAANAGYAPTTQLKVRSPITSDYVRQVATNAAASGAQPEGSPNDSAQQSTPQFDWQAWNSQMMAQQAAIWESMDQMNSEFLRKQEEYFAQKDTQNQQFRGLNVSGGLPADKAAVRRKKRTTATSSSATSTGLNTSTSGNALSLGGAQAAGTGLSIGKG